MNAPDGRLVFAFNMDCPEHGIGPPNHKPMQEHWRRVWLTLDQALQMRHMVDGMRLVQRDGNRALMEYLTYDFFPETEKSVDNPPPSSYNASIET
jgi:hypothetical protein